MCAAAAQTDNAFQLLAWLSGREWGSKVSSASPATTLYRRSQMRAPQPWLDPLTDSARFDVRNQAGANADTARAIRFTVKKTSTGATVREQVYDWATLVGL